MFKLIKRVFNKQKAKKLTLYLDILEKDFRIFKEIKFDFLQKDEILCALKKDDYFNGVLSRYAVCMQKVEEHNQHIQSLQNGYNYIIEKYPVKFIVASILDFDKNILKEIEKTIELVYGYIIPDKYPLKKSYDSYAKNFQYFIKNYSIIKEQKLLVLAIEKELFSLPDCYIDNEKSAELLFHAKELLSKYNSYEKRYFPVQSIDDSVIDNHNEEFICRHLQDSIFDNVNGKSLDNEQRRAILCDAKSNLTIAGAGSGKTLTICGKIKYLLEKQGVDKNDILLLSFSRASADDLAYKVNTIDENLNVQTFHALGLKILTEASGKKKAIEEQLKSYITRFFDKELTCDSKIADKIFQYVSLYYYALPINQKKYKNDGELFKDLKACDYRTLKDKLRELSNKNKLETLKNELVKSKEELSIANFLFANGINYEYEKPYEVETSTKDKKQYTPDFYLSDYGIYLEHYGIDRTGNAPQYTKEASDEYVASIRWKRKIHNENNTICIETYSYEFKEGNIFENLEKRLHEWGVEFKPLSQEQIFNALNNIYSGKDFGSFFNLLTTFISLYKSQIKDEKGFEELDKRLDSASYETNRTRLFLSICKELYRYYMDNLRNENKIDFDDMILQAIDLIDKSPNFKYKYIIVDEFQDISRSRTRFLQKLIEHGNAKLFAVGDDWQSIYRFAGCDINVFLNFDKIFSHAKLNYITSTHRNSVELQKIVEPFITANPSQYVKHIKSLKHQDKPVRIIYHNGNKAMAISKALSNIKSIDPNANVLVLGRNRHDIDAYICKEIQLKNYEEIKHRDFPSLKLKYSTVHGSKGLESDFVIIISGEDAQNGFPNKTEDDSILNLLLGKENSYEYAEERRLFYVALTRTKSIVYLLSNKDKSSEFINEIESKCFVMYDESEKRDSKEYICPWCKSGQLITRTSEASGKTFYGCSNYPYCTYINNDLKAVYNNNRCPECGDFLVLKKGKYGTFYGCHNYPNCKYTQQVLD